MSEPVVAEPVAIATLPVAIESAAPTLPAVVDPEPTPQPSPQASVPAVVAPVPTDAGEAPAGFLAEHDAKSAVEPSSAETTPAAVEPERAKAVEPVGETLPAPVPVDIFTHEFTLPPALKADQARMDVFRGILAEAPKDLAAAGQKLIDFHVEAMMAWDAELRRQQVAVFNETQRGWHTQVLADPEIGGSGHATAMGAIARMRDLLVSSARPDSKNEAERNRYARERTEFNEWLVVTGSGNHIVPMRILHNAARYLDEGSMPPPDALPPADIGKPPGASRGETLYTHPRSQTR